MQQVERRRQLDEFMLATASRIYSGMVMNLSYQATNDGRDITDNDLKEVAKYAKHATPFLAAEFGMIELKPNPEEK